MDDLKRYILENRAEFDDVPVPVGSRERFLVKAARLKNKRMWIWTGAAAILAAVFAVSGVYRGNDTAGLERMMLEMTRSEIEIMALVETNFPQDVESVGNTLRSIMSEAIPLASLLPDEMSDEERINVLKDYYGRKEEALERVKQYYENEIKEL